MTYSFTTISRDDGGNHIVRRPRESDAIGHALRNAFQGNIRLPEDMERMLGDLENIPRRIN